MGKGQRKRRRRKRQRRRDDVRRAARAAASAAAPAGDDHADKAEALENERRVGERRVEIRRAEDREGEEPKAEDREGEEPTAEDREGEDREAEEPTAEDRAGEEPTAEDGEGEEPTAEDREAEEPTAEDRAGEEPTAEDRAGEEPTAEDGEAEDRETADPLQNPVLPLSAFRGFSKGALIGLVGFIPALAVGVVVLGRLGLVRRNADPLEILLISAAFAGLPAILCAGGLGRLAARAALKSGRGAATRATVLAGAAAGAGLIILATVPLGGLPDQPKQWAWVALAGAIATGLIAACIGLWVYRPLGRHLATTAEPNVEGTLDEPE